MRGLQGGLISVKGGQTKQAQGHMDSGGYRRRARAGKRGHHMCTNFASIEVAG